MGSTVAKQLLAGGDVNVVVFDVFVPSKSRALEGVKYIQGDVGVYEHVLAATKEVDSVIHCAALLTKVDIPKSTMFRVNIVGTKNMLEASKRNGVQVFVFTSSASAIMDVSKFRDGVKLLSGREEDTPYPSRKEDYFEPYAWSKMVGEKEVFQAHCDTFTAAALRPPAIFHSRDGALAENLLTKGNYYTIGDGENQLDYAEVSCVARAHVLAEKTLRHDNSLGGQAYNIGNKTPVKYKEFIQAFMAEGEPTKIPVGVAKVMAWFNELSWELVGATPFSRWMSVKSVDIVTAGWWFDPSKAKHAFGYEAKDAIAVAKSLAKESRSKMARS